MAIPPTYPKGFDAHTHLDDARFDADRQDVVERAKIAGITGFAIAGADPLRWHRVAECAEQIRASFTLGVHPWWATAQLDLHEALHRLSAAACDGIGEIGLDFHRGRTDEERAVQRKFFRAQLAVARAADRLVVVHCVRAHAELIQILRQDGHPRLLFHGWSGSPQEAKAVLEIGAAISFGPLIARHGDNKAKRSLAATPRDRILLETDCPDNPMNGDLRGEPRDLVAVAGAAAAILGTTTNELLEHTADNARRFFGAPAP